MSRHRLVWLPELDCGYYPVDRFVYDDHYFEKYLGYDATPMGARLTAARVDFVRKHWAGKVLDVGIGGGRFVDEIGGVGFDVNPSAVNWLRGRGRYLDPAIDGPVEAATFWDSLEHMASPDVFLGLVKTWAFVSIPIFEHVVHVLGSKHFRPDEHYWYFTHGGFRRFMGQCGFQFVDVNAMEVHCGREDIQTFAFRRVFTP